MPTEFESSAWLPEYESSAVVRAASGLAHLDEYFGLWAIELGRFQSIIDHVNSSNIELHIAQNQGAANIEAADRKEFDVTPGGVAIIEVRGALMKHASSFSSSSSTVRMRRKIRLAARDPDVGAIVLRIDSPGGAVSGTFDLVDDIRNAAGHKPVHAFIEDLGASAAYAIATAATKIFANASALVGSIGTFAVLYDQSEAAAMAGIKVHVVKAGEFKGTGAPGAPLTAEQLMEVQRTVDAMNEFMLSTVGQGRGFSRSRVMEIADGRVHVARAALEMRLIDGVKSFDAVVAELSNQPRRRSMSASNSTEPKTVTDVLQASEGVIEATLAAPAGPRAATAAEIKAGCPGSADNPAFVVAQLEAGSILSVVQTAWMTLQHAAIEQATAAMNTPPAGGNKEALGGSDRTKKATASVDGIYDGDASDDYSQRVAELVAKGTNRKEAALQVARADPDLHQAFLLATNSPKHSTRIRERFVE